MIKKRPDVVLNFKVSDLPLPFPTSTYESTLNELVSDLIPLHEEKEELANRSARNKFLFHGDSSDEETEHEGDICDDRDDKVGKRSSGVNETDKTSEPNLFGPRSRFIWPYGSKQQLSSTRSLARSTSRSGSLQRHHRRCSKEKQSVKATEKCDRAVGNLVLVLSAD